MNHIDHIDPKWKDGRDYQLVCGLNVALNYNELDPTLNRIKSNRFLPYRGSAPVEPGEFHWFLNPHTQEWSWQEFCGSWWMEMTQPTYGQTQPKTVTESDRKRRSASAHALCAYNTGKKRGAHCSDAKSRISKGLTGIKRSEETKAKMAEAQRRRWAKHSKNAIL